MINIDSNVVVGRHLRLARASWHHYKGKRSKDPIAVQFNFDGFECRCATASDGWHILVDLEPLSAVDMSEVGSIYVEDFSDDERVKRLIGTTVTSVSAVSSPTVERQIGIKFSFSNGGVLILINYGDELTFFDKVPDSDQFGPILEVKLAALDGAT